MAYNNKKEFQKDDSLDWIKKNIEIGPFLKDRGWQKDKQNSTQKEETLINPKTGEKISVPVNPLSNGDRVWSFKKDRTKGGNLIQLLKNEGWDWKEIRDLAKGQVIISAQIPSPIHRVAEQKPKFSPQQARQLAQEKLEGIKQATGKDFLDAREIKKSTHTSLQGLQVSRQEAGFKLYQNFNQEGEADLCSTITYKTDQQGNRKKYFQKDLERGISLLLGSDQKLSEVKRIIVLESPVDALSYLQLEKEGRLHLKKQEEIPSTAFLSTCGSLTEQIKKDVGTIFKMAAEKNQHVVLAMDNDAAGKDMTKSLVAMAEAARCKYQVEIPAVGKDWNDQLCAEEKASEHTDPTIPIKEHMEKEKMQENPKLDESKSKKQTPENKSFFAQMIDGFKEVFNRERNLSKGYDHLKHPLYHAAQLGDVNKIEELAAKGADLNVQITQDVSAKEIDIAFLNLIKAGDLKNAKEILDHTKDLNVNVQDMNKDTALHILSIPVAIKAVKEKVEEEKRADNNIQLNRHLTVKDQVIGNAPKAHVAVKRDKTMVGFVPDFRMEIADKVAIVQAILERMADSNIKNNEGKTPLHLAAMYGNTQVAKALLKHGADVNIQDAKGNTPAHYATQKNHQDITSLLIEKGADLHLTNNEGREVIKMATGSNRDCSHNEVIGLVYQAMQAQKPIQVLDKSREIGMSM